MPVTSPAWHSLYGTNLGVWALWVSAPRSTSWKCGWGVFVVVGWLHHAAWVLADGVWQQPAARGGVARGGRPLPQQASAWLWADKSPVAPRGPCAVIRRWEVNALFFRLRKERHSVTLWHRLSPNQPLRDTHESMGVFCHCKCLCVCWSVLFVCMNVHVCMSVFVCVFFMFIFVMFVCASVWECVCVWFYSSTPTGLSAYSHPKVPPQGR